LRFSASTSPVGMSTYSLSTLALINPGRELPAPLREHLRVEDECPDGTRRRAVATAPSSSSRTELLVSLSSESAVVAFVGRSQNRGTTNSGCGHSVFVETPFAWECRPKRVKLRGRFLARPARAGTGGSWGSGGRDEGDSRAGGSCDDGATSIPSRGDPATARVGDRREQPR
jgi:hypothetical protein